MNKPKIRKPTKAQIAALNKEADMLFDVCSDAAERDDLSSYRDGVVSLGRRCDAAIRAGARLNRLCRIARLHAACFNAGRVIAASLWPDDKRQSAAWSERLQQLEAEVLRYFARAEVGIGLMVVSSDPPAKKASSNLKLKRKKQRA